MRYMTRSIQALLLIAAIAATAHAQAGDGAIAGTLKQTNGAPVSGATIQVIHKETGRRLETLTDNAGGFRLGSVTPGTYSLQAERVGFFKLTRDEIAVRGGETLALDLPIRSSLDDEQATANTPANIPVETSVVVAARRVEEEAQDVPIPVSVVNGRQVDNAGAFNVNRLKELIPTVQFYSSNPRNTAVNIRGLGSPFGLTNDGIEPGVGFYVDGVYFARPAAGTLDFLDVEQIEVLRGPQGTLFGKNTTAGSINIKTRKPSFTPQTNFELNYGNYGFVQAKASVSGPIAKNIAGRLSFSGTQRDGILFNVARNDDVNDLNNVGLRAQFLITLTNKIVITPSLDYSRQRPEGYAQVVAGVAPTQRAANRQYAQIASDLGYAPPSFNAFDRLIDTDTPWQSNQSLGGASVNVDWDLGSGVLTSTTAWRRWIWDPSNDRDFIGLPVTTLSEAPSRHKQWTQEIRYAGKAASNLQVVLGAFLFSQNLTSDPFHTQEQGEAAARFLLNPSAAASTPGLLDGYGQNITLSLDSTSAALFGQAEWTVAKRLRLIPGLRVNYDKKDMSFDSQIYGGLATSDPALIALQRSILAPQAYTANVDDANVSGQLTLAFQASEKANAYVTYSTSFKSVGLNLGGVPTDGAGNPILSAATVKPEAVRHVEFGVKTQPLTGVTANVTLFNSDIRDFQTQVVNDQVGVLRGYLANARKVRVRGVEFDGTAKVNTHLSFYTSAALTDGRYISFTDAPSPIENTGGAQVKDVSGSVLPGISKWAFSYGGEAVNPGSLFSQKGEFFAGFDGSYRASFSSSPSASRYMNIGAYSLVNARLGFRGTEGWALFLWGRNLLDRKYYELLSAAPGGSGLIVGLPGDPRMFGVTLRRSF